jgi:hypothetical protein
MLVDKLRKHFCMASFSLYDAIVHVSSLWKG